MKKRAFSLLLVLVMVIGLLPVTVRAGELDNGLEYEAYGSYVEITGFGSNAKEVVIPAEIEGLPVTMIRDDAFIWCDNLERIILPATVTYVGMYAFTNCRSLSGIFVDENNPIFSSDDLGALFNKNKTRLIQVPGAATAYTIPDSVTSIGAYAFKYCANLRSIDLPDQLTRIEVGTFTNCQSLTRISIPDSVSSIGGYAFNSCTNLSNIELPDNIPSIETGTFVDCQSLTSISIPGSVSSIGSHAFRNCVSLSSINFGGHLPEISSDAFSNVTATGYYPPNDPTWKAYGMQDYGGTITWEVYIPSESDFLYEVFEDHVEITDYYGTPTELMIPAEIDGLPVTAIANNAFEFCATLVSISIPECVTSIGNSAFRSCTSLSSITIPGKVRSIGGYAFQNCTSLSTIYFEGNEPYFGSNVFSNVTATAYYPPNKYYWTDYAMQDYGGDITWEMYIPAESGFVYEICEDHVEITDYYGAPIDLVIPAEIEGLPVTAITDFAFENCATLVSLSIPDSVTSIGSCAFAHCTGLSDITIPNSVASIGDRAFWTCSSLTSIEIPESVTNIGYAVFAYCSSLTGIHVEEDNPNYSSDDHGVLFDKEKTQVIRVPGTLADSYSIPATVTTIREYSFCRCNSLTSVSLPDGVTSIGEAAFADCRNLSSVSIPYGVTTIGGSAFFDCFNLANISIPDSVTYIGSWAFNGCPKLTSISIPSSVTYIGEEAFDGCCKLTSVCFKGDAPQLADNIFNEITTTVYYPAGNATWTEEVKKNYGGDITWIGYNPEGSFYDVEMGSWYEAPVEWAVEKSITNGVTADTFNPGGQCLRAQVVTFLHRAAENPEPTAVNNPFTDVKEADFFYKPVLWAVEKGITNGVSADKFGSYDVCNRAAVVTFLWRAAGSPEPTSTDNPFSDVKETDFFYKPVLWAVENGITNGISATEFGPTADCNRAQVVTFLYRACN